MRILGRLLLVFCLLVWLAGLGRLIWVWLTEPPPAREVTFVAVNGPLKGAPPHCRRSAFVAGRFIWQGCLQEGPDKEILRSGLVRFDLRRGLGELFWTTQQRDPWNVSAVAKSPDGNLTVAWGDGVYQVRQDGGLRQLQEGGRKVAGMAWAGELLELVEGGPEPAIHTYQKGRGWRTRRPPVPSGAEGSVVDLDLAYRSGGRWNLVFVRHPVNAPKGGQPLPVELLQGTESQTPLPVATIELASRFIRNGEGKVQILGSVVDRSPGSVVNFDATLPSLPLQRQHERWQPVEVPPVARKGGFWEFDYMVEPHGLQAIPRTTSDVMVVRVRGQWIQLVCNQHCRLRRLGEKAGPPLVSRSWLMPGFKILPAASGGYWLLGSLSRSYLRVNARFELVDSVTFAERIRRLFRRDRAKEPFLRELALLKLASAPAVLLLYPLLLLLLLIGRPRRPGGRSRRFFVASLIYLVCSAGLGTWFWQLTAYF